MLALRTCAAERVLGRNMSDFYMRCKDCKHWGNRPDSVADWQDHISKPIDPDTYEPMDLPHEVRRCYHPELRFCERPLEADGFAVADGSEYYAALYTGEAFGCVKWDAK